MIRIAVAADEVAVRECAEDAYAQYVAAIGKQPAPMVADFGSQITQGIVHVADHAGGGIDGFIVFFPRNQHMFLENVAVSTSASGRGVGRALINYCETRAREAGLTSVELYTNEKMTANLSMYPHLGYEIFERRREDGFDRVYFRKRLLPSAPP